mmetsp:Transcript_3056/g.5777  ORF Transcript_3056/g.5777 Transcript_3056/m.5777 type:complete len:104 (-) Transcript_3056:986-1297(-)
MNGLLARIKVLFILSLEVPSFKDAQNCCVLLKVVCREECSPDTGNKWARDGNKRLGCAQLDHKAARPFKFRTPSVKPPRLRPDKMKKHGEACRSTEKHGKAQG